MDDVSLTRRGSETIHNLGISPDEGFDRSMAGFIILEDGHAYAAANSICPSAGTLVLLQAGIPDTGVQLGEFTPMNDEMSKYRRYAHALKPLTPSARVIRIRKSLSF